MHSHVVSTLELITFLWMLFKESYQHRRRDDLISICFWFACLVDIQPHVLYSPIFFSFPPSQDVYHSHRPKEKVRLDSNNNENSVPKDFDSIDSNSNLGAQSQRQRVPVGNSKHKLDKAQVQSMLDKSANEVLKLPPVQPRGAGHSHSHNHTHIRKPHPQVPTVPALIQRSNQDPPSAGPEPKKEQPQCEISGKEAISALSRAKSRECRQQIVEVYCKHKERALMPEKVPRYCRVEGDSPVRWF